MHFISVVEFLLHGSTSFQSQQNVVKSKGLFVHST